ncbi:hypothetical protein JHK82_029420 [Glycine max]|nr:hypothetical protein JHK86_029535 [Glycine max]KAG5128585.1 hypothetical protein JHK82_029420 [Glycine max]KAG5153191.1 hypothetical protein JHK84_029663 [Glycine max]
MEKPMTFKESDSMIILWKPCCLNHGSTSMIEQVSIRTEKAETKLPRWSRISA